MTLNIKAARQGLYEITDNRRHVGSIANAAGHWLAYRVRYDARGRVIQEGKIIDVTRDLHHPSRLDERLRELDLCRGERS